MFVQQYLPEWATSILSSDIFIRYKVTCSPARAEVSWWMQRGAWEPKQGGPGSRGRSPSVTLGLKMFRRPPRKARTLPSQALDPASPSVPEHAPDPTWRLTQSDSMFSSILFQDQDLVSCPTVASRRRMGVAKKTPKMRTRIGRQPPQERARWGSLEKLSPPRALYV